MTTSMMMMMMMMMTTTTMLFRIILSQFELILHRYVLHKNANSVNIRTATKRHENSSTLWEISLRIFLVESHKMQLLSK